MPLYQLNDEHGTYAINSDVELDDKKIDELYLSEIVKPRTRERVIWEGANELERKDKEAMGAYIRNISGLEALELGAAKSIANAANSEPTNMGDVARSRIEYSDQEDAIQAVTASDLDWSARINNRVINEIDPEERESVLADIQALADTNRGLRSTAVVNGSLQIYPELVWTPDKAKEAIAGSEGTEEQKAALIAALPELRKKKAENELPEFNKLSEFQKFKEKNPELTDPADLIERYKAENDGWSDRLSEQVKLGLTQGRAQFAQQIQSIVGAALRKASELPVPFMEKQREDLKQIGDTFIDAAVTDTATESQELQQMSQRVGGSPLVADLTAGATSIVAPLAIGGVAGRVAGAVTRGVMTEAAAAQLASNAGFAGAVGASGLQSFGSTYSEAVKSYEQAFIDQGMDPLAAREQAADAAYLPAVTSGVSTAAITALGGKIGVESVFKLKADQAFRQTISTFIKGVSKDASGEFIEEATDEYISNLIALHSYDPSRSMEQIVEDSFKAGAIGSFLGGGVSTIKQIAQQREVEKIAPAVELARNNGAPETADALEALAIQTSERKWQAAEEAIASQAEATDSEVQATEELTADAQQDIPEPEVEAAPEIFDEIPTPTEEQPVPEPSESATSAQPAPPPEQKPETEGVDTELQQRLDSGSYAPEQVSRGTEQKGGPDSERAAEAARIARGSHGSISSPEGTAIPEFGDIENTHERVQRRLEVARQARPKETEDLRRWAQENDLLIDGEQWQAEWEAKGKARGAEHDVSYDPEQKRWFKRQRMESHSDYLEYLNRVVLHNALFPEAPMRLEGFIDSPSGLLPIVSQRHVQAKRGASREEVKATMKELGFEPAGGTRYINKTLGVIVSDLHDENALIVENAETGKEDVVFVDPAIFLETASKTRRLREIAGGSTSPAATEAPVAKDSLTTEKMSEERFNELVNQPTPPIPQPGENLGEVFEARAAALSNPEVQTYAGLERQDTMIYPAAPIPEGAELRWNESGKKGMKAIRPNLWLPVLTLADGTVINYFSNRADTVAQQLDRGMEVIVPEEFVRSGAINPRIQLTRKGDKYVVLGVDHPKFGQIQEPGDYSAAYQADQGRAEKQKQQVGEGSAFVSKYDRFDPAKRKPAKDEGRRMASFEAAAYAQRPDLEESFAPHIVDQIISTGRSLYLYELRGKEPVSPAVALRMVAADVGEKVSARPEAQQQASLDAPLSEEGTTTVGDLLSSVESDEVDSATDLARESLAEVVSQMSAPMARAWAELSEKIAGNQELTRQEQSRLEKITSQAQKVLAAKISETDPAAMPRSPFSLGFSGSNKLSKWLGDNWSRLFKAEGDLPKEVFEKWTERNGQVKSITRQISYTSRELHDALRKTFNIGSVEMFRKGLASVPTKFVKEMNDVLLGLAPITSVPVEVQGPLADMRRQIDELSNTMISEGIVDGDLAATLASNLGTYLTRSYRVHDDPKWASKIPAAVRNRARSFLLKELQATDPSATFDDAQRLMDSMLADWTAKGDQRFEGMGGKLGTKDLSIFKSRKNIPAEIRDLMGEYTSPLLNYARSLSKMASVIGNQRFLDQVKKIGDGKWLFEDGQEPKGYSELIAAEASDTMSPLNGLRTSKPIADAFREFGKSKRSDSWIFRAYMGLTATAKMAKTVGSVLSQVRNLVSQVYFFGMNGHGDLRPLKQATQAVLADTGISKNKAWQDYYRKMVELGIVDQSPYANELRETLEDAALNDANIDDFSERTLGKSLKRTLVQGPARMYQISDDVGKIVGFHNEQARLKEINPTWTDDQVDTEAARRIRLTFPTYSMVPEWVKQWRRQPVLGPFVTFSYEVFRTAFHALNFTIQDLKSSNAAARKAGMQRLAGQLAVIASGPMLTAVSKALLGYDDDDEKDIRRFLAPWSKDSQIMFLPSDNEGGEATYLNLSSSNPYAYLVDPILTAISGAQSEEDLLDVTAKSFGKLIQPFTSESILTGALLDISRNKNGQTGKPIYNEGDSAEEKFRDVMARIGEAIEPGTLTRLRKKIIPAAMGNETESGRELDLNREIAAELSGFRIEEIDYAQALGFKAYAFRENEQNAERIFREVALRGGQVTPDEMIEAAKRSNEARFKVWQELHKDTRAAIRRGVPVEEVQQILEDRKVGKEDTRNILRGIYEPAKLSKDAQAKMRDRNRTLPEEAKEVFQRRDLIEDRSGWLKKIAALRAKQQQP